MEKVKLSAYQKKTLKRLAELCKRFPEHNGHSIPWKTADPMRKAGVIKIVDSLISGAVCVPVNNWEDYV